MKTTRFNKLTAWVLTLAMLMTFIPSFTLSASAAGDVAAVTFGGSTTNYTSLSSAFSAVKSATEKDNAVVTLLADITLSYDTSISGGVLTLDLNGHTITCRGTEAAIWLYNSAKLTIVDSGEDGGFNVVYGIEDSAVICCDSSVLTISGGNFNKVAATFRSSDAQVNITGGTFDYNGQVIKYGPTCVANITGGTFAVEPDAYLVSEGFAAKPDADGTWVVAEGSDGSVDTVVAITDIIYSDYNGNDAVEVDEDNKTYTVTIPEGSGSVTVTVTVKGRNLNLIPEGNDQYGVGIIHVAYLSPDMYDAETGTMTLTYEIDECCAERFDSGIHVPYTLTSGHTYENTGWKLKVVKVEPITYTITATANPTEGGVVTGGGDYEENTSATVSATANEGYTFVNWTENGEEVSTDANYTFTVTTDCKLMANFEKNPPEVELYTANGAQMRVAGTQGLRFISTIVKNDAFENVVEYGTVLIPTESLDDGDIENLVIGKSMANGHAVCKVEAKVLMAEDETSATYTAVITNIAEQNYTRSYTARAYAILDDGTVVYSDTSTSRSIYQIAKLILEDDNATEEEVTAAQAIVDVVEKYGDNDSAWPWN